MPYMNNQWTPNPPQPSNNLWVGNNYSGFSPNRSTVNQVPNYMPQTPMPSYQPEPVPQTINNIYSVMGPESAEEFRIGPNSKVILLDSYRPVMYMKRSDDSGYSETHAFKISEIPLNMVSSMTAETLPETTTQENTNTVTKQDLDEIKCMIEKLTSAEKHDTETRELYGEAVPSLFITKEEFDDFKKTINEFKNMIEELVTKNV